MLLNKDSFLPHIVRKCLIKQTSDYYVIFRINENDSKWGKKRETIVFHYTVHFQRRLIYIAAGLTDIQRETDSLAGGFSRKSAHGCGPESLAESQKE